MKWTRSGAASQGIEESLPPVALGKLEPTSESPPQSGMKKKKKKKILSADPPILPGEIIWQVEIFHTVFPVGDKFTDFAAGKKSSRMLWGTSPPWSPEDEFAVCVMEIALSD
jgi:hypothetical protein